VRMLDRKLLREIGGAKGLLLAITSIIAIGVSCYVCMQSAYLNLSLAKQRYYRQCRMGDFWIDLKKAPEAELRQVADIPGVAIMQPRIQFLATMDVPRATEPINGIVLSLPERRETIVNDIVLRRGSYFTDRRDNEVIVNATFAEARGIHPGQYIHVLLNNRRQELFVVGTALSSEFAYLLGPGAMMPDPQHFGVLYIKHHYAEEVFDFNGAANQVVGRLEPAYRDHPERVLREAERLLEPYGVLATTPLKLQASNQYLSNEIAGLASMATILPVVFLTVAALVLNVLMTRLARQQRVVVGTLKALGYSNTQVFFHFLKFGSVVGIAGSVLGSILGYLFATGMTHVYNQYFEFPDLVSAFYAHTHLVGLAVSLACAIAGTMHGARSMLKLHPAEAMRPAPPRRGGAIFLERFATIWNRLSAGWRVAIRSIVRHRFRTAAGVFAAAMGAGLLVAGFMMNEAADYMVDFQFHRVSRSDVDLVFKGAQGEEVLTELKQLPGVDLVEPQLNVGCTFVNGAARRKGGIIGVLPDAQLTMPRDRDGQRLRIPDTGLVVNRRLAEILDVGPGDDLTIVPVEGDRHPLSVPVAEITDSFMGLAVYADIHFLSRLRDEEFAVSGAQLKTVNNREEINQLYRELKQLPAIESITSRRHMVNMLTDTIIQNQRVMIFMLVFFSGAVFFGSVLNSSMVSLAERSREVATLGALGYTPWEIGGMFLRETMVVNLLGALLGLPIGYGLTELTAYGFNNDLLRLPVVTAPWIWWWTIGLSIAFSLAAHAIVQWRIYCMDLLESLKVKE